MKKSISHIFPYLTVLAILASMMFSHSCANTTQAPTGGDKDTIPSVIVKVYPEMGAVNVPTHGAKIVFTFDEYVKVKTASNIFLSPPQQKYPKSKVKGKSIIITFDEDLDSNTTYTLDLTDAIADNNEGNMFPGFTYVFSTGPTIDSMMVTGIVQDCNNLKPVKGATVLLYKDLADSAIFLHRPDAAAKTDDWGYFSIRNIQDTVYRMYAIKDANNDNMYEPEDEIVAFIDSLIRPKTVVNDSLPELQKYDMKDTTSCLARKTEYELNIFREKPTKQYLKNKKRVADRYAYVSFQAPNAHIDSMWVSGFKANQLITQFNISRDSLEIWLNARRKMPDTLKMNFNYRKTDSLGHLVPFLEKVNLTFEKEEKKSGNNSSNEEDSRKSKKKEIKHEDTLCVYTLKAEPSTFEQLGYDLMFNYPIINEAFDSLKFISINPKQKEAPAKYEVVRDTNNLRHYTIMPKEQLLPGYEYSLTIPHRKFRDINGFFNDSTVVKVSLPTDETLSTLNLNLTGVHQKYIVDLLTETRDKVVRSFIVDEDKTLVFPYLSKGKYCIRITEDKNRNSLVDTGALLEHRQPEKVLFYKMKDDEIPFEILESSETDQDINLEEMFKD